jgi:hypothetical protein
MENNLLNWPDNSVIIGDYAFTLINTLLNPYNKVNLTLKQKIFNYRLSRARRVSENAFGILTQRYRVFGRPNELKVSKIDLVINECLLSSQLANNNFIQLHQHGVR